MTLRPYQETLLLEASAGWRAGHRRVLAVLPTGGGKGRIIASATQRTAARNKRVSLMAHREELVDQICSNLDDEDVQYGRIQPGWPLLPYPVQVGMVQTIVRRLGKLIAPDLLIIDEAHHTSAATYQKIMEAWDRARSLGVTATPVGNDGKGLDDSFDFMAIGPTMVELQDLGHLAKYNYYMPSPDFDADAAKLGIDGDYATKDAVALMNTAKIVGDAVGHYKKYLLGKPAIAFCYGIDHCVSTANEFRAGGIRSAHVDGKMPKDIRRQRLAGLANGEIHVLTAADVISEGLDIPAVAGGIFLRPTTSLRLFLQQAGRTFRVKEDGSLATILDHVGNAKRHGLPADPRMWSLAGVESKPAALQECKACYRVFHAGTGKAIAQAECRKAQAGQFCPVLSPSRDSGLISSREPLLAVAGELEAVGDGWAWAGVDPRKPASDPQWTRAIGLARRLEQFQMIGRALGYKPYWAVLAYRRKVQTSRRP